MSYTITEQRRLTMIERIGEAVDLIDNQAFLPFYRSVQIKLEKLGRADEWGKMIAKAKGADNAKRYFARLCKMVKDDTYIFVDKVVETVKISGALALELADRLVKFGFGKYQKYYVRKAKEFIDKNSMAGFIELLEFADRKGISQKYMAKALINGKRPANYYKENVLGVTK
jgi:hypothetical protein